MYNSELASTSDGMDNDSPRISNSSESGGRVLAGLSRCEPPPELYLIPPPSPNPSTAASTPFASRSTSPLPGFYPLQSSSCPSDTDSEISTYDISPRQHFRSWKHNKKPWWSLSSGRRRRDQGFRISRCARRLPRRILFLPFFYNQPSTIASVFFFSFLFFCVNVSLFLLDLYPYFIFFISCGNYPLYNVPS